MVERIGHSELFVMDVLWKAVGPLSATEIANRLAPAQQWNDSTIKTMLSRLVAKGVLTHEQHGRAYLYRPAIDRQRYAAGESRRLVDRLFDGRAAPLVAHLARGDGLSREDIAELEALLAEMRR